MGRSGSPLPAIALVSCILVAGCAGVGPTDQQPPTPEATVETVTYPSGWSQTGITNLSAALQTHAVTVRNTSRSSRLVTTNGDRNRTIVRTYDADAGTAELRFVDTEFDTDIHVYYDDTGVYEYDHTTGDVEQRPDEEWTPASVATHEGLRRPLAELELTATETVTVAGRTAVNYTVTGIRNPGAVPADAASGHIIVAETGVIAAYNITRGNDEFTRQTSYEVSEYGEATVSRPAWMPET